MTTVMLDSTVERTHMCAPGGSRTGGTQERHALGRSRGGFSSKIHIVVDALGFPLRYSLTGGERHDVTQAEPLLVPLQFGCAIADRAYDSEPLLKMVIAKQAEAIIPPRRNRTAQRDYDKQLYKERNVIERFINKVKWCRRIFTRYEKLARRYIAFLHLAATSVWLK